MVITS